MLQYLQPNITIGFGRRGVHTIESARATDKLPCIEKLFFEFSNIICDFSLIADRIPTLEQRILIYLYWLFILICVYTHIQCPGLFANNF